MTCPVCGTIICSASSTIAGINIVCPTRGEYDISNASAAVQPSAGKHLERSALFRAEITFPWQLWL